MGCRVGFPAAAKSTSDACSLSLGHGAGDESLLPLSGTRNRLNLSFLVCSRHSELKRRKFRLWPRRGPSSLLSTHERPLNHLPNVRNN